MSHAGLPPPSLRGGDSDANPRKPSCRAGLPLNACPGPPARLAHPLLTEGRLTAGGSHGLSGTWTRGVWGRLSPSRPLLVLASNAKRPAGASDFRAVGPLEAELSWASTLKLSSNPKATCFRIDSRSVCRALPSALLNVGPQSRRGDERRGSGATRCTGESDTRDAFTLPWVGTGARGLVMERHLP